MSGSGREHGDPYKLKPDQVMSAKGRSGILVPLLLLGFMALFLRLPHIGDRPMHNDEACQAVKFTQLLEHGFYQYDPADHHGPTLYYLTLPVAWITAIWSSKPPDEAVLRFVPLLFAAGSILLLGLLRGGVGRSTLVLAAAFAVCSPALTYYSRYYIQETPFVFFTMLLIAAGWRYGCTGRGGWAVLCGVAAGCLAATKETAVLVLAGAAVALAATTIRRREERAEFFRDRFRWSHLVLAALSAAAVLVLFFSSFFTNPGGVADSVLAFGKFANRARGSGHEKGFEYYLHLLTWQKNGGFWWGEGALFIPCLAGAWLAWRRPANTLIRMVSACALALLIVYGMIPYKTPWLMLGVIQLAALPAAFAFTEAWKRFAPVPARIAVVAALVIALGSLWRQSGQANGRFAADERNPWVYSHTSRDCLSGVKTIRDALARFPGGTSNTVVKVMSHEYWPLPWYLRDCGRVGYWTSLPDDPLAAIMVVSADQAPMLESRLEGSGPYTTHIFGLRPGVILTVYIRQP